MRLDSVENGQARASTADQQREITVEFYNPPGNAPMIPRINALCLKFQRGRRNAPRQSSSIRPTAPTVPAVDTPPRPQSPHAHQAR